jgi:hypothetical protein
MKLANLRKKAENSFKIGDLVKSAIVEDEFILGIVVKITIYKQYSLLDVYWTHLGKTTPAYPFSLAKIVPNVRSRTMPD